MTTTQAPAPSASPSRPRDYSLVGNDSARAVELGLAEAQWYTCPVPREEMRKLLERRNGPAIRDTLIWFALLGLTGWAGWALWGSWWAVIPFALYGVLYGSSSDSRWHESSHGTAFKTDWMNNALYEIASFMVMRESTVWRWSHTRHHSDTIIVGRDPEIAVPRPPDIRALLLNFFALPVIPKYFRHVMLHAAGVMTDEEQTFIPAEAYKKVYLRARIYLLIYASAVGAALYYHTILPLMFIGLPNIYGGWLMPIYGYTQHAGLADNVLDHRLNCRTVYMNRLNRYLYWNMNYHLEHHMFPLVPYHALPRLHELIKDDCPTPYSGLWEAWCEMIPAVLRQVKEPGYFVERKLPENRGGASAETHGAKTIVSDVAPDDGGWIEVCESERLKKEDVLRFDHGGKTFAIYRTEDGSFYATDGMCTHGQAHLADGFVKGRLIECPKHNGRFDVTDGSPQRPPVCVGLTTYKVREVGGRIQLGLVPSNRGAGGRDVAAETTYSFRVVSNDNVATFIKELVLEPEESSPALSYQPGDYLKLDIPAYGELRFSDFAVGAPYREIWRAQGLFELTARNGEPTRRNFSLATNPAVDRQLRFNVRLSTPPRGIECLPGVGSSYVFSLKPGDRVTAVGPFGDFRIKSGEREMIYLGGGAGMAPLRSHLAHLFETQRTRRQVSFWYGARSAMELFYQDYFLDLARRHENFGFHVALSEPVAGEAANWRVGFIHDVLRRDYLAAHPDPAAAEYYLCGPPAMIQAARAMLAELGVPEEQIAFDEF